MTNRLRNILKKHSGRDATGKVSVRHTGGRSKRFYRSIDFKRNKFDIEGKVIAIEYDPNRSADIALIHYKDGDKRYILAPIGLSVGNTVISSKTAEIRPGNSLPMDAIPVGTFVHNVELTHGRGGQIARSAGDQAVIMAREDKYVHVKMPSSEVRKISAVNCATIGQVGKVEWKDRVLGKAGRSRNMGIRPHVRGVAMNPRSHPHGGGEGRSGIGMKFPKTYAGRPAVGKTRNKKKPSGKFIISRRKKTR